MMATSSLFLGEGVTSKGLPAQQRAGEIDNGKALRARSRQAR